jgi:hypothetical protein
VVFFISNENENEDESLDENELFHLDPAGNAEGASSLRDSVTTATGERNEDQ